MIFIRLCALSLIKLRFKKVSVAYYVLSHLIHEKLRYSNYLNNGFIVFMFLAPLFVIQWLFDEVQLNSDRIDILNLRTLRENRRFWQYITELEKNMRDSLKSVRYKVNSSILQFMMFIPNQLHWSIVSTIRQLKTKYPRWRTHFPHPQFRIVHFFVKIDNIRKLSME